MQLSFDTWPEYPLSHHLMTDFGLTVEGLVKATLVTHTTTEAHTQQNNNAITKYAACMEKPKYCSGQHYNKCI